MKIAGFRYFNGPPSISVRRTSTSKIYTHRLTSDNAAVSISIPISYESNIRVKCFGDESDIRDCTAYHSSVLSKT